MPKNRYNILYALSIPLLLLILGSANYRLKTREKNVDQLTHTIESLSAVTQKINAEALTHKTNLTGFLPELTAHTVPADSPIEWCIFKMSSLTSETDLKADFEYLGPDVPFEMQVPRLLRQTGSIRHPYLAPYLVQVSTSGSLKDLYSFSRQMEHPRHAMVISKLSLRPDTNSDHYLLKATLSFPHMLYAEDEAEIKKYLQP